MRAPAEFFQRFADLHRGPGVFVVANPWDALSARLLAAAGFPALATTSAGVAWAHDRADGQRITRGELLDAVAKVAAAAGVPVSADLEAGFGDTPAEVAETVRQVIEAGAVGVNLEDADLGGAVVAGAESPDLLRPAAEHAQRVRAAREAAAQLGVNLFINARTDVYLLGVGAPPTRFENAVARARSYVEAGADGIFVPGVSDPETIARLVEAIPAPLNVLLLADTPPVPELARLGVRRLSTGGRLAQASLGLLRQAAVELREQGTYGRIFEYALPFADLQELFGKG